jgi:hypothetical protein
VSCTSLLINKSNIIMKHNHTEENEYQFNPSTQSSTVQASMHPGKARLVKGFPKVVAGGRIVRLQKEKPFLERMVTGGLRSESENSNSGAHEQAVLASVASNLEAGIEMVGQQEVCLAKIGGRLSEIALSLNQVRSPHSDDGDGMDLQVRFESSRDEIRKLAQSTFDNTALFSKGDAKPITIAVPTHGEWEGISVDRANIEQPGLVTVDHGKLCGPGHGYTLDPGSVKRAFDEWRSLCINNRMQWGLLMDRLHGANQSLHNVMNGEQWTIPKIPENGTLGPLRRPHRNN